MLGHSAWELASTSRHLTDDVVEDATRRALDELDDGMHRVRCNRCATAERRYLGAMARVVRSQGVEEVTGSDVARILDRTPRQLSSLRQRLIDKKLIERVDNTRIRFTLPLYVPERAEPGLDTETARWPSTARHLPPTGRDQPSAAAHRPSGDTTAHDITRRRAAPDQPPASTDMPTPTEPPGGRHRGLSL